MEDELEIKELLIALWNKKIFIIVVTIICAIFGVVKYKLFNNADKIQTFNEEDNCKIGTSFIIGTRDVPVSENFTNPDNINLKEKVEVNDVLVATYEQILKSQHNLNRLIEELNLDIKIKKLEKMISLRRINNSEILEIDVTSDDEELAENMSIKLAEFLEQDIKELYNVSSITLIDTGKIVEEDEIKVNQENNNSNETTTEESKSSPIKKVIIVTMMGFLVASGIIVVIEIFDTTVKNEKMLEKNTQLKTLAIIPNSEQSNEGNFKILRVNINECKTMLITSPRSSEGKTYVATNLAQSFNALGKNVLFIDLVNEKDNLIENYNEKGLTDYLAENDKNIEKYINSSNIKNLSVLTLGKDNGKVTELLESKKMAETLANLEKMYDVIIIDGGSILEDANTLAIAKISQFSILVINKRKTDIDDVIRAKNNIEDIGGNVLGNVFNKA